MAWLAVFPLPLTSGLGAGNNDALSARGASFAFDSHGDNGKRKA